MRESVAERWRPYKARPSPSDPLGRRFHTGTFPYELLAGLNATYDYLDSIGGFGAIRPYERALGERFVTGLPEGATLYGLPGIDGRLPTFLINVEGVPAAEVATRLSARGYGVWAHDSWYSLGLYHRLGYEDAAVRIGLAHYNTVEEVDGLLAELGALAQQ